MTPDEFVRLCQHGTARQIREAIEAGADVDAKDEHGKTALMIAARKGAKAGRERLKLLIEAGADVNATDSAGWTALMHVAERGVKDEAERLKLLIEAGADVNARTKDGRTALLRAADQGVSECLAVLLDAGADVDARDEHGKTALMMAARRGAKEGRECLRLLIEAGADVNATDSAGWTALMHVAERGVKDEAERLKLLIEAGADVNARTKGGRTALMYTALPESIGVLLEAGADVHARTDEGRTALMMTAMNRAPKSGAALRALIDAGADPNAKDDDGMTVLMWAAEQGTPESIDALLKAGADLNAKNGKGMTALMCAANSHALGLHDPAAVIRRLAKAGLRTPEGLDTEARTRDGRTALLWATRWGDPESIDALLEAGADLNARDARGAGALDLVRRRKWWCALRLRDTGTMARLEEAIRRSGAAAAPVDREGAPGPKPFPYDEFCPVFMEELKSLFSRFIDQKRDERPYAFALVPMKYYKPSDYPYFHFPYQSDLFFLRASGNTVAAFDSRGVGTAAEFRARAKELVARREAEGIPLEKESKKLCREVFGDDRPAAFTYYYYSEWWKDDTFTDEDFSRSNAIIENYLMENEADLLDPFDSDHEAYEDLETELLDRLIGCLKRLRAEGYFESVYPERISINCQPWYTWFSTEEEMRIFEELNSPEEAKLYALYAHHYS